MEKPAIEIVFRERVLQIVFLDRPELRIGRGAENQIVLDNVAVSREHARVAEEGDGFLVEDLGSSNGTFVNGARIHKRLLALGDEIGIAKYVLRLRLLDPDRCQDTLRADAKPSGESAREPTVVADKEATRRMREKIKTSPLPIEEMRLPHPGTRTRKGFGTTRFASGEGGEKDEPPAGHSPDDLAPTVHGLRVFLGEKLICEARIPETGLTIGRSSECDLILASDDVSRKHARIIEWEKAKFRVEDLGSRNGLTVNGLKVLKLGLSLEDEIRIGTFRLVFSDIPEAQGREEDGLSGSGSDGLASEGGTRAAYLKRSAPPVTAEKTGEDEKGTTRVALGHGVSGLHGGEIEVRFRGQIFRFALKSDKASVVNSEKNSEETVCIRLALGDWILENTFPVSAMRKLRSLQK